MKARQYLLRLFLILEVVLHQLSITVHGNSCFYDDVAYHLGRKKNVITKTDNRITSPSKCRDVCSGLCSGDMSHLCDGDIVWEFIYYFQNSRWESKRISHICACVNYKRELKRQLIGGRLKLIGGKLKRVGRFYKDTAGEPCFYDDVTYHLSPGKVVARNTAIVSPSKCREYCPAVAGAKSWEFLYHWGSYDLYIVCLCVDHSKGASVKLLSNQGLIGGAIKQNERFWSPYWGCYEGDGRDYNHESKLNITKTGKTCQRWDSHTPHKHGETAWEDAGNYPDETVADAANHCRNPGGEEMPFCMTTDPKTFHEECNIPKCEPPRALLTAGYQVPCINHTGVNGCSKPGDYTFYWCYIDKKDDNGKNMWNFCSEYEGYDTIGRKCTSACKRENADYNWCYVEGGWGQCGVNTALKKTFRCLDYMNECAAMAKLGLCDKRLEELGVSARTKCKVSCDNCG